MYTQRHGNSYNGESEILATRPPFHCVVPAEPNQIMGGPIHSWTKTYPIHVKTLQAKHAHRRPEVLIWTTYILVHGGSTQYVP